MEIILPIAYLCAFVLQIVLLIFAIKDRKKKNWLNLLVFEIGSILIALIFMAYYNGLPGYGTMPGLTYFAETMYSLFAAIVYGLMLIVSAVIGACRDFK